jgi:hypothetical protein
MKRITVNATLLTAAFFLFTAAGYAQQLTSNLKADVPFEFNVGQKTFPAGQYQFAEVANNTLALRDGSRRFIAAVMTAPMITIAPGFTAKLRFESVGGHLVLSEVWTDGGTGYKLSIPKQITLAEPGQ